MLAVWSVSPSGHLERSGTVSLDLPHVVVKETNRFIGSLSKFQSGY